MVLDKVENATRDSLDRLKDKLRELAMGGILPDEVVALVTGVVLDKMSYSPQVDFARYAEETSPADAAQLEADIERLPAGMVMMVCPGGDRRCGTDIVRSLKVSKTVPETYRTKMETAIKNWTHEMNTIATEASKCGVPMVVRYDLTASGPELALGYGREHHGAHGGAAGATTSLH